MPERNLFATAVGTIGWHDVDTFLNQKLPEGERIEYKLELNNRVTESIAAMSNARGGLILVGVATDATNQPVLPPAGVSVDHVRGGTLANLCHARLQPLFVPDHRFVPLPDTPNRGILVVQVRSDTAPIPIWEVDKGVLVRVADQNRPADLAKLQALLNVSGSRLQPLYDKAAHDIGLALQSNADGRTYVVVGAAIQRQSSSDQWTTSDRRVLQEAVFTAVSDRRVQVRHSATAIVLEPRQPSHGASSGTAGLETFVRISLAVEGIVVIVFGWKISPFPVPLAIVGLLAGTRILLSQQLAKVYEPAAPMEVTLGLVNWPSGGLAIDDLYPLSRPQPIGGLSGYRVTRRFAAHDGSTPWAIVGPFLSYVLADAGFVDYERYLDAPPGDVALVRAAEGTGLRPT